LVRETGRANRVAVPSRDKTDVSRGGGGEYMMDLICLPPWCSRWQRRDL